MGKPKQQPPQSTFMIDPKLGFGPVSGPLLGAGAALLLTMVIWASQQPRVGHGHGLPNWLPMAVTGAMVLVFAAVAYFRPPQRTVDMVFQVSCWIGAGLWSTVALTVMRDQFLFMLVALGVLATAAGLYAKYALGAAAKPAEVSQNSFVQTPLGYRDAWEVGIEHYVGRLLSLRDGETVTVQRTNTWPNEAGATFQIGFSAGSSKGIGDLKNITTALQQCLRLPDGCAVIPKKSGMQGVVLLDVMFFNDLVTVHNYPTDFKPRSARDDIPIGLHGDRTWSTINLYQKSAIIIGIRGGGKTVLLQNITAWLMQCVDVVVWIVDLNGGALGMPWTYDAAIGKYQGYPVDWVAHTPDVALKMGEAAVRIAKARKSEYAALLVDDDDKLKITKDLPMLLILVDEGAELMGDTATRVAMEATEAFQEAQRIGRAMCVNIIFCGQRATSDYMPAQAKKLADIKIALRVDDDSELAHLYGWSNRPLYSSEDMIHDGTMLVRTSSGGKIGLVKGLYIKPSVMRACAEATIMWRPKLDDVSARAAGYDYTNRWEDPETVEWLNSIRRSAFAKLGTLIDPATGMLRGPAAGPASPATATTTAVLDRPDDLPPQPTGGRSEGHDRDPAATMREVRRIQQENDDLAAKLGLPPVGAGTGYIPGSDVPPTGGAGGGDDDAGAHDRDAMIRRKVAGMDSGEMLEAIAGSWEAADDAADEPPFDVEPATAASEPEPDDGRSGREKILQILRDHGGTMRVQQIRDAAEKQNINLSRRQSLSEWLAMLLNEGLVTSPKYGHYQAVRKPEA